MNLKLQGSMFKRSKAWFGLLPAGRLRGETTLTLLTMHCLSSRGPAGNKLCSIFPTFEGHKVPYTFDFQPAELTLVTDHGNIRFTFASLSQLIAEGDPGMGLMFTKHMVKHETVNPRKNGAWEAVFRYSSSFIFKGLDGSTFDFNGGENYWSWEDLSANDICGRTYPNEKGTFTLMMEECSYCGIVRDSYPTYAEGKKSMQDDWDSFFAKMKPFIAPFESVREEVAYSLWSFVTGPYFNAHYPMIQMFAGAMASQWQMCQNAVAFQDHPGLAIDLLLGPIDKISPEGQLPDMYDDAGIETERIKPPVHGWAVLEIMKHNNLKEIWPLDKLEMLYKGIGAWADWFMNCRDDDGDGLPSVDHSDETGLDDNTIFTKDIQLTTPCTSAFLVLDYEAAGKLARILGKPEEEAAAWEKKSQDLLVRLVSKLWDGEHFVAYNPHTKEKIYSTSVLHYMPLVLGKRLPQEIIDKMVADLMVPGEFFSPVGLATEKMNSDYFTMTGFARGGVLPPPMIFICTGLAETAKKDTAYMLADLYMRGLMKNNFPFSMNPQTGGMGGFPAGGSWPRCAFMILGRLFGE